ncbi:Signal transduction histidine kinase [Marinitoga hydrogenitolerans DSM 16785]|uniref:histidine kinase n=1 Tax=Marinitoga hydrogenitolerans (strain DSM 16785 / JCM 12826 / AT1271) TaxID=1122195 RepID=A0A1M4T1J3_MARH1|nr:HAMP domain-containing sensor histidine kinase [Marinitoga hydrogenitolerans]SHE38250.1 Signal transduction histidine kinase [Marinitoga hydrogenitolerans DSM 16785]
MDTFLKKNKKSVVLNLTIIYTSIIIIILLAVIFSMRYFVEIMSIKSYATILKQQIEKVSEPNPIMGRTMGKMMGNILHDTERLKRSIISNRVIILDGIILNDPYGIVDEKIFNLNKAYAAYQKDGIYYIFVKTKIFDNSTLIIGGPSLEYTAVIKTFNSLALNLSLISILVSLLVSYYFAKRSLRPLLDISKEISEINVETLNKRIPEQKFVEFHKLAENINSMLEKIDKGYELQKQFVSDVSHELRTPLTSIIGYIKLIERWGKDEEKIFFESLENIKESSNYLKEMIENLLLLTKTEEEIKFEKINIKEVVEKIISIYKNEGIKINTDLKDLYIETNKDYLSILLKVIIENAIKFTKLNSEDEIFVKINNNSIEIVDKGPGIEKDEIPKIFERFYKSDKSRSVKGFGLGLSIAKKISEKINVKIEIISDMGKGSTFKIKFS